MTVIWCIERGERKDRKNNTGITIRKLITESGRRPIQARRTRKNILILVISSITNMLKNMTKAYGVRKRDSGLRILLGMETAFIHV